VSDEDNEFAFADKWPWYWRYPLALAVLAAAAGMVYATQDRPVWMPWMFGLVGVGISLRIAREAGCAVLILLGVGVCVLLGDWIFGAMPETWQGNLPVVFGIAAVYAGWVQLHNAIREVRDELRAQRAVLDRIEQQGIDAYHRHYDR